MSLCLCGTITEIIRESIFADDLKIAHKQGVIRKIHACKKLDYPVLQAEMPWEATGVNAYDRRVYIYGTVLRDPDNGTFRMWYNRHFETLLYATSHDGVSWHRPDLGLVEFNESTQNNILPLRLHSPSMIFDPQDSDVKQRYKMLGYSPGKKGYVVAHSSDGLRWSLYPHNPVLSGADTCTLAQDPQTGEFLVFHKQYNIHRGHSRRLVYLAVSKDMQTWSEPKLLMAPDERDDTQTLAESGVCSEFYNMSVFPYAGHWLGMVTHFRYSGSPKQPGPAQSPDDGPIDVQLVHSRDGRSWARFEDRSPVIPNGPYHYDAGCILGVCNTPLFVDDEVWMYYTAITTTHGGYLPEKQISIARAVWRRDGFVSLDADEQGGTVTTVVLCPEGQSLFVNADAASGELKVELLDEAGTPLPGYSLQDVLPVRGDGLRQTIHWRDHTTLPTGRPIRIRFFLKNTRLFSYMLK